MTRGTVYALVTPGDDHTVFLRVVTAWKNKVVCEEAGRVPLRVIPLGRIVAAEGLGLLHRLDERDRRPPCPSCQGTVELVLDGLVDGRWAPFLACGTCEWCGQLEGID